VLDSELTVFEFHSHPLQCWVWPWSSSLPSCAAASMQCNLVPT